MLNANAKFVTPSFEWSLEWRLREGEEGRGQTGRGRRDLWEGHLMGRARVSSLIITSSSQSTARADAK